MLTFFFFLSFLPYSTLTISSHITIILIITHLYQYFTSKSTDQLIHWYTDTLIQIRSWTFNRRRSGWGWCGACTLFLMLIILPILLIFLFWLSCMSYAIDVLSLYLSLPMCLCVMCHGYHISCGVVHWRANAGLLLSYLSCYKFDTIKLIY